jgi:hypothetical protein
MNNDSSFNNNSNTNSFIGLHSNNTKSSIGLNNMNYNQNISSNGNTIYRNSETNKSINLHTFSFHSNDSDDLSLEYDINEKKRKLNGMSSTYNGELEEKTIKNDNINILSSNNFKENHNTFNFNTNDHHSNSIYDCFGAVDNPKKDQIVPLFDNKNDIQKETFSNHKEKNKTVVDSIFPSFNDKNTGITTKNNDHIINLDYNIINPYRIETKEDSKLQKWLMMPISAVVGGMDSIFNKRINNLNPMKNYKEEKDQNNIKIESAIIPEYTKREEKVDKLNFIGLFTSYSNNYNDNKKEEKNRDKNTAKKKEFDINWEKVALVSKGLLRIVETERNCRQLYEAYKNNRSREDLDYIDQKNKDLINKKKKKKISKKD